MTAPAPPYAVVRLRQATACLLLVVLAFHQSPGLIGQDTKIDLTADPSRFLGRALDLWNPSSAFGQIQNQAYGYLFPMGPFHLLGALLGAPGWVVQRTWMAVLLVTALLGVARLAARLELGTPSTRLLGAFAYALSPRVLTEIGSNSSETLPLALLPWVLVPLVGLAAEQHPRRSAMRSGVAVLCMGAVNATAVLALLPLPALWLMPGLRRGSGRRLAGWWVVAVTLASTWWLVPLVLQGRYSPNFLNYIETAATTTGTTSLSEVTRGTSHWLAYVSTGGSPWWRSAWTLVTNGGVILNTAVLAGLGVAGLLRRRMPAQGRLAAAAAISLLVMSVGHQTTLGSPFSGTVRDALDGPLAPFRNVHKFDPDLRLALALGLCHLLALAAAGPPRRALAVLATLALIGTSAPALAGQLVPSGAYEQLPSWWRSTGAWLDDHSGQGRALVIPARGFGEYLWGRPLDDPLQALTRSPRAVRDAVPLGAAGSTRLLDAIGARLDTGVGSAAMAQVLARSGVRYLVVANDLDRGRTGAPDPVMVHQALADSPGIVQVAAFGPLVGDLGKDRSLVADHGLDLPYQAVEVFEVLGETAPVSALPEAGTWVVSGGPESLFQLADRGLLGATATVLVGDGDPGPTPRSAVTDALRRREVGFGSVRDNASATLTPDQALTRRQAAPDILPVPGAQHLATARYVGATSVTASSSAADAGAVFDRSPAHQPFSAFDGDNGTSWVTGSITGATGQWVQVALDNPVDPTGTTLRLLQDAQVRGTVERVTVRTDIGSLTTSVRAGEQTQVLAVPAGLTRQLRLTFDKVASDGFGTLVGVRELNIPGVNVQETIVLPRDQSLRGDAVFLLDRAVGARSGCADSVCSPRLGRTGEDVVRLDRTFTLDRARVLPVVGSARPVAGPALDALLEKALTVRAVASSQLVPDPAVRPDAAVDGDPTTAWVAGAKDRTPTLTVTWAGQRVVDHLTLRTAGEVPAARPTRVAVVTPAGTTTATVGPGGLVRFTRVRTSSLTLRVLAVEKRTSFEPDGTVVPLTVGIGEVTVPGVVAIRPPASLRVPCGQGPPLVVDGQTHPTAVLGTRDDLLRLRPLLLSLCDVPEGLQLGAGEHRVTGGAYQGLELESLTFGTALPTTTAAPRQTQALRWDAEHRVVKVGAGEASYLVVHENANRGWQAVLDGKVLSPARIDGWQQAWIVPEGPGGRVTVTFLPGRTFHLALLGGGLLVLLLVGLALLPSAARPTEEHRTVRLPLGLRVVGGAVVLGSLGGPVGLTAYTVILLLLVVGRRSPRIREVLVGVVGAALVGTGLLTAYAPWNGSRTPAAFGTPVQVLALLALAAAAAVLSAPRWSSDASGSAPAALRALG